MFEDLFETIDHEKKKIYRVIKENGEKGLIVSKFLKDQGFDQETVEVVEQLIADGRTVYYGKLCSDSGKCAEAYYCCGSFMALSLYEVILRQAEQAGVQQIPLGEGIPTSILILQSS